MPEESTTMTTSQFCCGGYVKRYCVACHQERREMRKYACDAASGNVIRKTRRGRCRTIARYRPKRDRLGVSPSAADDACCCCCTNDIKADSACLRGELLRDELFEVAYVLQRLDLGSLEFDAELCFGGDD